MDLFCLFLEIIFIIYLCIYLVVLDFKLRALCLMDKYSTTASLFFCFERGACCVSQAVLLFELS
jgi:hypothetical protein